MHDLLAEGEESKAKTIKAGFSILIANVCRYLGIDLAEFLRRIRESCDRTRAFYTASD